jgi:hypothetical protein
MPLDASRTNGHALPAMPKRAPAKARAAAKAPATRPARKLAARRLYDAQQGRRKPARRRTRGCPANLACRSIRPTSRTSTSTAASASPRSARRSSSRRVDHEISVLSGLRRAQRRSGRQDAAAPCDLRRLPDRSRPAAQASVGPQVAEAPAAQTAAAQCNEDHVRLRLSPAFFDLVREVRTAHFAGMPSPAADQVDTGPDRPDDAEPPEDRWPPSPVDRIGEYRCRVCGMKCDKKTWVFCVGTEPDGQAYVHTYCGPQHAADAGDWLRDKVIDNHKQIGPDPQ